MRPGREASGKSRTSPGGSLFEQLLTASSGKVQGEGNGFVRGLLSAPFPVPPHPSAEGGEDTRFRESLAVVLKHEGSAYVRRDGGRESSRFGILQSTAREYGYRGEVRHLTRAEAESIYRKIWDKSGAASLPPPLSMVHFDTYVNSPAAARKLLDRSGGDVNAYLGLRAQRYRRLAELRPQRYARYLKGWMNRIASLRDLASGRIPGHPSSGQAPPKGIASAGSTPEGTLGENTA
ncbi:MAG: hypothetical protein K8I29_08315 [Alphaproteobacteria bacterium]|uniref:TtsA-like Glycoside hydrolase family 108 domain-containing protein n=1 Tax=Candidatus Nitrobium versatile TaxID=2884831 RepID=A0A953LWR2_9BACT|nr:hypothetical protein [Candidatus Nitrobium versatile]